MAALDKVLSSGFDAIEMAHGGPVCWIPHNSLIVLPTVDILVAAANLELYRFMFTTTTTTSFEKV